MLKAKRQCNSLFVKCNIRSDEFVKNEQKLEAPVIQLDIESIFLCTLKQFGEETTVAISFHVQ